MLDIVYFSNFSNNTHRFVEKLDIEGTIKRIPIMEPFEEEILNPYVLITPTYGIKRGIPIQVIKFMKENRRMMAGVIASGNINFGKDFAKAGYMISQTCKVPLLYTFELLGTKEDVTKVEEGLTQYVVRNTK